jgi:LacI family transcriptional regulator
VAKINVAITLSLVGYEREVYRGAKECAHRRGDVELFMWEPCHDVGLTRQARQRLSTMGIRGILACVTMTPAHNPLKAAGIPVVDVSGTWEDLPGVHADNHVVGRLAARHLLSKGLRSFAFWGMPGPAHCVQRREGFLAALKEAGFGCTVVEEKLLAWPLSSAQLTKFRRRMDPLVKPLGLFGWYDLQAASIVAACRQTGIRVPDDIAVIGSDNDEFSQMLSPVPLSSVDVNAFRIGYEAMETLLRMIRTGRRPGAHVLVPPGNVMARQSTDLLAIDHTEVAAAVRFIQNHADKPITVSDVLKEVPISRRRLEIHFRRILGRSPLEQIQFAHIERAKMLTQDLKLSLGETARLCGFDDQAFFCRVFKRYANCTPRQYRQQFKQSGGHR